jgi:hypothetical protein
MGVLTGFTRCGECRCAMKLLAGQLHKTAQRHKNEARRYSRERKVFHIRSTIKAHPNAVKPSSCDATKGHMRQRAGPLCVGLPRTPQGK